MECGILTVKLNDSRKWYEYLGFAFGAGDFTVYLPDKTYNSLKIDLSTGDINVPKTTSGGICEITTSTGDIEITIIS